MLNKNTSPYFFLVVAFAFIFSWHFMFSVIFFLFSWSLSCFHCSPFILAKIVSLPHPTSFYLKKIFSHLFSVIYIYIYSFFINHTIPFFFFWLKLFTSISTSFLSFQLCLLPFDSVHPTCFNVRSLCRLFFLAPIFSFWMFSVFFIILFLYFFLRHSYSQYNQTANEVNNVKKYESKWWKRRSFNR